MNMNGRIAWDLHLRRIITAVSYQIHMHIFTLPFFNQTEFFLSHLARLRNDPEERIPRFAIWTYAELVCIGNKGILLASIGHKKGCHVSGH